MEADAFPLRAIHAAGAVINNQQVIINMRMFQLPPEAWNTGVVEVLLSFVRLQADGTKRGNIAVKKSCDKKVPSIYKEGNGVM